MEKDKMKVEKTREGEGGMERMREEEKVREREEGREE